MRISFPWFLGKNLFWVNHQSNKWTLFPRIVVLALKYKTPLFFKVKIYDILTKIDEKLIWLEISKNPWQCIFSHSFPQLTCMLNMQFSWGNECKVDLPSHSFCVVGMPRRFAMHILKIGLFCNSYIKLVTKFRIFTVTCTYIRVGPIIFKL